MILYDDRAGKLKGLSHASRAIRKLWLSNSRFYFIWNCEWKKGREDGENGSVQYSSPTRQFKVGRMYKDVLKEFRGLGWNEEFHQYRISSVVETFKVQITFMFYYNRMSRIAASYSLLLCAGPTFMMIPFLMKWTSVRRWRWTLELCVYNAHAKKQESDVLLPERWRERDSCTETINPWR